MEETSTKFVEIIEMVKEMKTKITLLQNNLKSLDKMVGRQMRIMQKAKNKGKNRRPSGFAVPTPISKELCKFMDKPEGSEVARTEVTQYIIKYIKDHNLQWEENRKVIKPDVSLKSLLQMKGDEELTYFNIQRFMNKHFVKVV